jgi:hypothetical protein
MVSGDSWILDRVGVVAPGGLVVSVLDIGPNVCGFKPGRGRWILKAIKIRSTSSFGGEVKPSAPCRKTLRHGNHLSPFSCFATRCLYW